MPWDLRRRRGRWCVIKQGETSPVPGGCHESREEAVGHLRALYAGEEAAMSIKEFAEQPAFTESAMVALYPRPEEASAMAAEDGLDWDTLHVTLVFLGDAEGIDDAAASRAVEKAATAVGPLSGTIGGVGMFGENENGVPMILLPDVKGLTLLRERVVDELEQAGISSPSEHGFLPHMTLAYRDGDAGPEGHDLIGKEVHFDAVSVVVGEERMDHAFSEGEEASPTGGTVMNVTQTEFENVRLSWTAVTSLVAGTTVTVSVSEEEEEPEEEGEEQKSSDVRWRGILAYEGKPTGDRRFLIPGEISHRELPIPFMAQFQTADGHEGAHIAGKITEVWWQDSEEDGVIEIWGEGPFDSGEMGQEAARLAEEDVLIGVSIDLAPTERLLLDPETYEPVDPDEMDLLEALFGGVGFLTGFKGKIMGATLVPFPSFEDARIDVITAGGMVIRPITKTDDQPGGAVVPDLLTKQVSQEMREALTAAAGPVKPPREWFDDPRLTELTPLQITDDGHVFGHLADWDGCHTGFQGICIPPFRSASNYAYFNVGEIECADGSKVPCGKLMFSRDGGKHAPLDMNAQQASDHYDDSTKIGAFVRAGTDRFGTWLSGVLRHDLSEADVQHIRANPPSGDWRPVKGGAELVAAFAVPVPGFPIPRAIVASADGENYTFISAPLAYGPKRRKRKMAMLRSRVVAALGEEQEEEMERSERRAVEAEFGDGFAYTAEQRRRMAKNGQALPDGSFPIANCADADRAIRAQGRAKDQERAVAHIRKRVRALGCSGDIFDDYK